MRRVPWACGLVLLVCTCSAEETPTPTAGKVGPQGGAVSASDGRLTITVPPGAVAGETEITITPTTSSVPGALGPVFDIGPDGLTFAVPVTLTFSYSDSELGGKSASDLEVLTLVGQAWQPAASSAVNSTAHTVSATTTHLSKWTFGIVGGSSTGCPQAAVWPGDLCTTQGRHCKWDKSSTGGGLTEAECDGKNWWVAETPNGCPVQRPSDGAGCGSFSGRCQYFDTAPYRIHTCACIQGKFACVNTYDCPDKKYVTFGPDTMGTPSQDPTKNLIIILFGVPVQSQQCYPGHFVYDITKPNCSYVPPLDDAIGPLATGISYKYCEVQCMCEDTGQYRCWVFNSICPTAFLGQFPSTTYICNPGGTATQCGYGAQGTCKCLDQVSYEKQIQCCPGCWSKDSVVGYQCLDGTSVSACGKEGNACTTCGTGATCVGGSCVSAP